MFLGGLILFFGIITAFQGLITNVIGVIPGIFAIIIGRLIFNTGIQARNILKSKNEKTDIINIILKEISLSFKAVGILIGIFIISYGSFILMLKLYE